MLRNISLGMIFFVLLVAGSFSGIVSASAAQEVQGKSNVNKSTLSTTSPVQSTSQATIAASLYLQQEEAAKEAEKSGRYLDALEKYWQLCASANLNDVQFQRFAASARAMLAYAVLELKPGSSKVFIGKSFTEPVQVAANHTGTSRLKLALTVRKGVVADNNLPLQEILIDLPVAAWKQIDLKNPDMVGLYTVAAGFVIPDASQVVSGMEGTRKIAMQSLLDDLRHKLVTYELEVESEAKKNSTAVIIVEKNAKGQSNLASQTTMQVVAAALTTAGFTVPSLPLGPGYLEGKATNDILVQLKNTVGSRAKRLVFGAVSVSEVNESVNGTEVHLTSDIVVADTATGTVIYLLKGSYAATGLKVADATKLAFSEAGRQIARELAGSLP